MDLVISIKNFVGLRPMHCLTNTGTWQLHIDLTFTNGTKTYMQYKQFSVGSVYDQYRLSVSGFVGVTPTDPFAPHPINGQPFSTVDRLNYGTCARNGHGSNSPEGWWYRNYFHINLNYNYAEQPKL
ncbi:ryncolin-1-like [Dysidea avara]|uniref:ryncolin-1-like n=1 Tax=Dysidea avara TaxID=196820 RepID=UPI003321F863